MSKNDNFTTSVSSVSDVNGVLGVRHLGSIFRDEVFKDIVRYKFTASILIKYTLRKYQEMHPIEIARLIKDTREHNVSNDEELLQDEIDTVNLTLGTGAEKNTENDFVFEIYQSTEKKSTDIVTINFEMQGNFSKENPNTISRAIYYGGTLLRETVPAGDTYYIGMHKVYTIWFCNASVHFMSWSTDDVCKALGKDCYLYKHRYNIRRSYDEFPNHIVSLEPESDLIEVDFIELPVLRKKVRDGKAEDYEKLFLQFMESTESSLPFMEKEYGVELVKYKQGVSDMMSLEERLELKYEEALKEGLKELRKKVEEEERKKAEEERKKAEEERKKLILGAVNLCFKFKTPKEQVYNTVLETNPDISIEFLEKAILEVYGE